MLPVKPDVRELSDTAAWHRDSRPHPICHNLEISLDSLCNFHTKRQRNTSPETMLQRPSFEQLGSLRILRAPPTSTDSCSSSFSSLTVQNLNEASFGRMARPLTRRDESITAISPRIRRCTQSVCVRPATQFDNSTQRIEVFMRRK